MRRHKVVAATLLIAAVASYADLPRLHSALSVGDVLNLARVADPVEHVRMLQQLTRLGSRAGKLKQDLNDGQRSLALIDNVPPIRAVVPSVWCFNAPSLADGTPRPDFGDALSAQPLAGIAGALLTLDLPPPKYQALWQPPRLQLPTIPAIRLCSRGPPLS